MNEHYYGVIMAGGVGSRFWPLSRKKLPKQFIDIFQDDKTLFQSSYERIKELCKPENIFVVTNEAYRDIIKEQQPEIPDNNILGEPSPRNTAPCIAYACMKILNRDAKAIISVVPSDHLILDQNNFVTQFNKAYQFAADNDVLLTLGIKPTRPDTGYGYIQYNDELENDGFYKVKTFTEKPNLQLAEEFLKSGDFVWNSGMFVWRASSIMNSFEMYMPELHKDFKSVISSFDTTAEQEAINKVYETCTIISIDYAIMEKAKNVYTLPAYFQWSDIGTWNAMYLYSPQDENGNVIYGDMVFTRNANNCVVRVGNKKLVALNNVENLIIVESDNILLVADLNQEQDIRHVVNDIKIRYGEKFI
ncbi:MAG: mannose-1-phosphate guanylyltransferase [Bacteroidota bacterium]|nr:mannose-1-phosphate guanylyltransferase [Bacteroidota bacterium]